MSSDVFDWVHLSLFILFLFILAVLLWLLISPIVSIIIAALIAYAYNLRRLIGKVMQKK